MSKDELMSVKLTNEAKAFLNNLDTLSNGTTNIQTGKYNFNNVDNLTLVTQNESNEKKAIRTSYINGFNNIYYNLLVVNSVFLNEGCIKVKMPQNVSIKTKYGTSLDQYKEFEKQTAEIQNQIINFPTLIVDNNAPRSAVSRVYAIVCKIIDIKYEQDGTVIFTLVKVKDEPYTKEFIMENANVLNIGMSKGVTELDEVHWAIKKANLKEILNLKGVI